MINLMYQQIRHKCWGVGNVVEQTNSYIKIAFDVGIKQFQYPEAFEKFLECVSPQLQEEVALALDNKEQEEAEKKRKCQELIATENTMRNTSSSPLRKKKKYTKENIAFKCNFCDGGKETNGIGYRCACSDELINYNIEKAHHKWCCSEESPCSQYYDGMIDRTTLDGYVEEESFVCYESQMLRNWTAFAGYVLTGETKQKPMKLNKVQINSLAILTTRIPYAPEKDRFIFGVFLVDDAYEGDNRDEGYVTTSSKYKLSLPLEQARKILFWNYYHNENAPEKTAWGQGLHRYITDIQAACILRDIAKLKEHTAEEELAKDFLEYFCKINCLDKDNLPELDGALKRE